MDKKICPDCGKELALHTIVCPVCRSAQRMELKEERSDTEYQYLSARDYSAPENYPGY